MSKLMQDDNYKKWIKDLAKRYRSSQIKASINVNGEMLIFYYSLGKDIFDRQQENKYGNNFFDSLSVDLTNAIPNIKSFSPRNLRYMEKFYEFIKESINLPQLGAKLENITKNKILPQVDANLDYKNNKIFMLPWGHIKLLIDKCHNNPERFNFYINKVLENNWSRATLLNFLDTNLYERQGKAITNFETTLLNEEGDLAQEITKDPYNFDFIQITDNYKEAELKAALMDNIQKFLMELGTGFAFVGKEYRLQVGQTEQFIDMLFYNVIRHCYVVIEVKIVEFDPSFISQTATYVSAVNHILKGKNDTQTIGLLICKTKDNILAKYAVETSKEPIGISEYELNNLLPEDFKGTLPSIEDLEKALKI